MGCTLIFIKWALWNVTVLESLYIIQQILKPFRLHHCVRSFCLGFQYCWALWTGLRISRKILWGLWLGSLQIYSSSSLAFLFQRFSRRWMSFFRDEITLAEEKCVCVCFCGCFACKEEMFRRFPLITESMCNRSQRNISVRNLGFGFQP